MFGARSRNEEAGGAADLFRRIGQFLSDHRLSPEPAHYAFAYQVLSDPAGPLARVVDQLTDGGVRLSRHDIERLGGRVSAGAPMAAAARDSSAAARPDANEAAGLIARTQVQVADFGRMMRSMQDETRGFGRDLQASADAIRVGDGLALDHVVTLTGAMIDRVRAAEDRLDAANEEASDLRAKLEEAQGDARHDPLTGLANRRALAEAFRGLTGRGPACLAICDVDRFKQVNDHFGHGVGDRVLTAIGQTLAAGCGGHLTVRYGGEEFAVLFAGVELSAARQILESARQTVAGRRFRDRETGAPLGTITFSAGLGDVAAGEPLDTATDRIDRALYQAKAEGRNRLVMADPPMIGA